RGTPLPAPPAPQPTPAPAAPGDAARADVPVVALDLASLDAEAKGAIADKLQPRGEAPNPEELTEDDLKYWYALLADAHEVYMSGDADAATRSIVRAYRAAVLGRYL